MNYTPLSDQLCDLCGSFNPDTFRAAISRPDGTTSPERFCSTVCAHRAMYKALELRTEPDNITRLYEGRPIEFADFCKKATIAVLPTHQPKKRKDPRPLTVAISN